jgi:hypothetical protein
MYSYLWFWRFFFFFSGMLLSQKRKACRIGPCLSLQDESVKESPEESLSCWPQRFDDGVELTATLGVKILCLSLHSSRYTLESVYPWG